MNMLSLGSFPRPNSEGSIDMSGLSQKQSFAKRANPQFEKFRNSLKGNLFSHENPISLNDLRTESSPLTITGSQENLTFGHKKNHQSESTSPNRERLQKFRHHVKGSLLFLSHHNSLSFSPENCRSTKDSPQLGFGDLIKPLSLSGTSSFIDENCRTDEDLLLLNPQKMISELEERSSNVSSTTDILESEEGRDFCPDLTGSKIVISKQRQHIFYDSSEVEIEDLKKELQIDDSSHIHFFKGDFSAFYKERKILGEGTSGVVKKCIKVGTDEAYAVKIIPYRGDNEILTLILKEFGNMRKLNHKNITKVYELYVDIFKKRIYTVMELAECREMFEVLKDLGHYSEQVASGIFKQVLTAINYLHTNGVCHRDIKPNNILVSKDGKIVKITDFNVSKFLDKKDHKKKYSSLSTDNYKMWTYTGTIAFTAPEVFLNSDYAEGVDVWSAGVVLYTMLCGYQPFQAEYVHDLIELIKEGKYQFHPEEWNNISDQAKDLVCHCLDKNPKTRYSPSDALMHPWIANQGKVPDVKISNIKDNFRSYYKKYTSKKNFTNAFEMKKVQVTSPDFGVTVSTIRPRRRSGTMRLNAPYWNKSVIDKDLKEDPKLEQNAISEYESKDKDSENLTLIKEEKETFERGDNEGPKLDRSSSYGLVESDKSHERTTKAIQEDDEVLAECFKKMKDGVLLQIDDKGKDEVCIREYSNEDSLDEKY